MNSVPAVTASAPESVGILVNNHRLVESLRSALASGMHAFKMVPRALDETIDDRAWMRRMDRNSGRHDYASEELFSQFITDPTPRGLGTTVDEIRKYLGGSENPLRVKFEALLEKRPGNRTSDIQSRSNGQFSRIPNTIRNTDTENDLDTQSVPFIPKPERDRSSEPAAGTSVGYAVRRLGRERPDILEKVEAGEISANRGMIEAGLRPRTITLTLEPQAAARLILKHFEDECLLELTRVLANHAGYDLVERDRA